MPIINIERARPVQGLYPELIPAYWVDGGKSWLQCGGCGFNGEPTHYIFVYDERCYAPVCNCPLPATLTA